MDSLTFTSSAVPQHLTSVPTENQHSVDIINTGIGSSISLACDSAPMILNKMDAAPDNIIHAKTGKLFSPGIPRSSPNSLSNEISGQTASAVLASNGGQPFSVFPPMNETQDKGGCVPGTTPSSELSPQFDLNYPLGTCPNVTQSCSSSSSIVGSSVNFCTANTAGVLPTAPGSVSAATLTMPSPLANKVQHQGLRSDIPQPPKKPLSPYMRFSKEMWQQVKAANPGMSVCEVGAAIGRIWRELDSANKQRFIQDFNNDKARYGTELQGYLRTTGLQVSDIIKPRARKAAKDPASAKRPKGQNQKSHDAQHDPTAGTNYHQPTTTTQCPASDVQQQQLNYAEHGSQELSVALPSFSQVWPNPDATARRDLLAQVVFDSQLHDERDVSEIETASRGMSAFSNRAQFAPSSVPSAVCSNEQKIQQPKVPLSRVKTEADDWWWSVENKEQYRGMNALQQTGGNAAALQQHSTGAPPFTEVAVKTEGCSASKTSETLSATCNWSEGNGAMACKGTAVGNDVWLGQQQQQQQHQQQQQSDAPQRVPRPNEGNGCVVDAEKLFLRGALVEKTQEVVQLMRELEQAYGLIQQLKNQNDFFHRWYQEQRSVQE